MKLASFGDTTLKTGNVKQMGRLLISAGILLIVVGLLIVLSEKLGIRIGHLPGDIRIEGRGGSFYFPIVTCLLVSVALSLLSWLFSRR
jgi:hypothetical protein